METNIFVNPCLRLDLKIW